MTGCKPAEIQAIFLNHEANACATNNVSFNEGSKVVLHNAQFTIVLLHIPNETISKLKVGMLVTVEGTIVRDGEGWALDDVVFDPIAGIDSSQAGPTATFDLSFNESFDSLGNWASQSSKEVIGSVSDGVYILI